jgi:hypothetical protein
MTKTTKSAAKPSADEAAKKAVGDHPGATAEGVASAAGIGRSTATKALARLGEAGEVTRFDGGREGGKRLPDRFTLTGVELPPAYAGHTTSGPAAPAETAKQSGTATPANASGAKAASTTDDGKPSVPAADAERLRPGQLEPLVLAYLKEHADSGPHGPTTVARALDRSSGAVGNCLVRLAEAKKVRQEGDKPRRYSLAA